MASLIAHWSSFGLTQSTRRLVSLDLPLAEYCVPAIPHVSTLVQERVVLLVLPRYRFFCALHHLEVAHELVRERILLTVT